MISTLFDAMPSEWKLVRIKDIFNLYKGTTPSTKVPEYWNGNIPFVTPTDITALKHSNHVFLERTSKYLTEKGLKSKRLKLVPRNSLLVTTRATIGECAINKIEVAINQGIVALIPKDHNKIDVLFYYYLIQIMKSYLKGLAGGSTYKEISLKRLSEIQIPMPPLDEQRKIAKILYTVDMAIAKTEAVISKIEELRRALLDYLMTHGIGHKDYKETEIGKIPKEWKVVKIGDVAKIDTEPIRPKPGEKYYYIGLEDIESETGRILKDENELIDGSQIKSTKYVFSKEHVLYGRLRPYLNKVALPTRDGICSTDILPVLPNKNLILREYLAYLMRLPRFVEWATSRMKGTNHPRISSRDLLEYKIPLPPIDEQKKIVEIISSVERLRDIELQKKEQLMALKTQLMNLLLTGKVRVKDLSIN